MASSFRTLGNRPPRHEWQGTGHPSKAACCVEMPVQGNLLADRLYARSVMMLSRFFSRRASARSGEPSGTVPEGQRLYAVGDIHGRRDLLDALLDAIVADNAGRPAADTQIIFLGDLVDRGPDSAGVVERLLQMERDTPGTRFLLGNHEEVFLKAFDGDLKALPFFIRIGGRETILSYGVTEADYLKADYPELLELMHRHVPADHIAFLKRFEDLIVHGDYAFVHAGVRPGEPLARQRASDLRWIREEFLTHAAAHEKIIVHGHTIFENVEIHPHRIGLDTGAYRSGRLSAMAFEGSERWLLEAAL